MTSKFSLELDKMNNPFIADKPLLIVLRSSCTRVDFDFAMFKFSNSCLKVASLAGLVKSLLKVILEDPELEEELE
jgi:hypothetical protein